MCKAVCSTDENSRSPHGRRLANAPRQDSVTYSIRLSGSVNESEPCEFAWPFVYQWVHFYWSLSFKLCRPRITQYKQDDKMRKHHALRSSILPLSRWPWSIWPAPGLAFRRSVRHQAFDASFDQDELAEARKWHQSFQPVSLPEGNTSFSRSSGPGGQHVNKFVDSSLSGNH
jgi:hypothetical protein